MLREHEPAMLRSHLRDELTLLVQRYTLEKVQAAIFELGGSKLRPTGDASRDRLVRERLGLRV